LAFLLNNQTEPENTVYRLLHFQSLRRLKMGAHPYAARDAQYVSVSLSAVTE